MDEKKFRFLKACKFALIYNRDKILKTVSKNLSLKLLPAGEENQIIIAYPDEPKESSSAEHHGDAPSMDLRPDRGDE
jgi:hypothetical protein